MGPRKLLDKIGNEFTISILDLKQWEFEIQINVQILLCSSLVKTFRKRNDLPYGKNRFLQTVIILVPYKEVLSSTQVQLQRGFFHSPLRRRVSHIPYCGLKILKEIV